MNDLGCVTGRFQPVHDQHLTLFEMALEERDHLIVAITNPHSGSRKQVATSSHRHTSASNPFTYFERARLIDAAVRDRGFDGRVTVVPFDLTHPEFWSQFVPPSTRQYVRVYSDWERQKALWLGQAGYDVKVLDGDTSNRLSSTDIREAMRSAQQHWRSLVPKATVLLLEQMLPGLALEERV